MPKKEKKEGEPPLAGRGKRHEKAISLYPLTLGEAVDRLLQVRPEKSRGGKAKSTGPSADATASRTR